MGFDVFISYPHQDKAVADAACAKLEATGIRCWIAPRDISPSAEWAASIVEAIDECRVMVLIFSTHANRSKQVHREVQQAFDGEKPVVPFRIENINPEKTLRYYMASVHWLDALTPPLEGHLQELAASVAALVRVAASPGDAQRSSEQRRAEEGFEARRLAQEEQHSDEEERRRREAEIKRHEKEARELEDQQRRKGEVAAVEAQSAKARRLREEAEAQHRAEEEQRRRAPPLPPPPTWRPSRPALLIGLLVCVALLAAIGTWVAAPPATVAPKTASILPTQAADTPLSPDGEQALKPKDVFQECGNCPKMIVVPAGSYTMGSPASEPGRKADEGPQHAVTVVRQFAVGQFELAFDEWDACGAEGSCNVYKPSDQGWGRGRRPVINVSWGDANAYVAWLAKKTGKPYRLLSEAEYEYATRAGTTTAYPWGDDLGKNNANCYGCGSQWDNKMTAPVGSFAANGFGLYDMAGNVGEWTEDCYHDSYNGAPADGSAWTSGECNRRVLRSGTWGDIPKNIRSAVRGRNNTDIRYEFIGFRVARTFVR